MKPLRLAPFAVALGLMSAGTAASVAGQSVVPVHEEPRHRLVHDAPDLRILDILIQPGDTTLFHRHDAPIAYVQIAASVVNQQTLGGDWGAVRRDAPTPGVVPGRVTWNERYRDEPVSHRVTALGPGHFRLIGVINRGVGGGPEWAHTFGPFAEPEGGSRFFRRSRHELPAGESLTWVANARPVVVVLTSGQRVVVAEGGEDPDGTPISLSGPGDVAVMAAGRSYTLLNRGPGSAMVALVEVR